MAHRRRWPRKCACRQVRIRRAPAPKRPDSDLCWPRDRTPHFIPRRSMSEALPPDVELGPHSSLNASGRVVARNALSGYVALALGALLGLLTTPVLLQQL